MKRIRNWRRNLCTWAATRRGEDFDWGRTDCASLAMKACGVMYHHDFFPFVDEYRTLREAKEVFEGLGIGFDEILLRAGAERVSTVYARSGDIMVGPDTVEGFPSAYVMLPSMIVTSNTDEGVVFLRRHVFNQLDTFRFPREIE